MRAPGYGFALLAIAAGTALGQRSRVPFRAPPLPRALMLGGSALLLVAGLLLLRDAQVARNAKRVDGVVVAFERTLHSNHFAYAPIVEFESAGGPRRVTGSVKSFPAAYELGDRIPVFVDPSDPESARLDSLDERFFLAGFFGALGAVATIMGFVTRRSRAA